MTTTEQRREHRRDQQHPAPHPQHPAGSRAAWLRWSAAVAAAAGVGLLAGCSTPASTPAGDTAATQASTVTVTDPWVKAAPGGMTAAFGVLGNTGSADARLVSVSSPATTRMEIHEVSASADGSMAMRPKDGGVVVPGGGEHTLEPGGDHLMLMELTGPVTTGQDVRLTLVFEDGSTVDVTAPARDFVGNNEDYVPGHGSGTDGAAEYESPDPQTPAAAGHTGHAGHGG